MITVVCWNIDSRHEPWTELREMNADVALLQEVGVGQVPDKLPDDWEIGGNGHWAADLSDRWPAIVKMSNNVEVEWFDPVPVATVNREWNLEDVEVPISDARTIAIARVTPRRGEPFIAVSMYARWLAYHSLTRGTSKCISDNSMHRIISDFSIFIRHANPRKHRILLAGDMNAYYGAIHERGNGKKSNGKPYRETSAFDRLDSLGMAFLGPQHPNGRQSERVDDSIAVGTKNVATYRPKRRGRENQLDYVFASRGFHESIRTRALNGIDEWGSSDHCRILIEID